MNRAIAQQAPRGPDSADLIPLIDALIDVYVSWREECAAVATSYARWSSCERRDRRLAFSAYTAALDREEQAAAFYRCRVEQIRRVHTAVSSSTARSGQTTPVSSPGAALWNPRSLAQRIWSCLS